MTPLKPQLNIFEAKAEVRNRSPGVAELATAALTVRFGGGHVCEQQQAGVLRQAADESQPTQQQLWQTLGKPAVVEVKIRSSDQVARSRVEADAAAPNVAFGHAANGRTDGWQVV